MIRDWIDDHSGVFKAIVIVFLLIVIVFVIRGINMSRKAQQNNYLGDESIVSESIISINNTIQQDEVDEPEPVSSYQAQLGLGTGDDRVVVDIIDEPIEEPIEVNVQTEPTYPVSYLIWQDGQVLTDVPPALGGGTSFKGYLSSVTLSNFGSKWGSSLTENDFFSKTLYLCGTKQNPNDFVILPDNAPEKGLVSAGWVMNNIGTFNMNDCFKFTNLHVIGSLSNDYTVLLCTTDWYSVDGIKDMLVVFEDISGNIGVDTLKSCDTFSCIIYAHNMKVVNVNEQRVLVIEYADFE